MKRLSCFERTLLRFCVLKPCALTSKHRGGVVSSDRTARPAALRLAPFAGPAAACYRTSSLGGLDFHFLLYRTSRSRPPTPEAKHACRGQKNKNFIHKQPFNQE